VKYYATCINEAGEELMLIAKAATEELALHHLNTKYKIQQVVHITTEAPKKAKSYYASEWGVHMAQTMPQRRPKKGMAT
jgi:hypothetical protein